MRALILAAGVGERLKPLTDQLPKCLIPVAGRPILAHQLSVFQAIGVSSVCIVAGAHHKKVSAFAADAKDVSVVYNAEYASSNILYSFWLYLRDARPDEDLLVTAGDVVFEQAVAELLNRHGGRDMALCVNRRKCGAEEVKARVDKSCVSELGKQLEPASAYGEFLGFFRVAAGAIDAVKRVTEAMIGEGRRDAYLFEMINRMIRVEKCSAAAVEVNDLLWEEIDFPEDVERASKRLSACAGAEHG